MYFWIQNISLPHSRYLILASSIYLKIHFFKEWNNTIFTVLCKYTMLLSVFILQLIETQIIFNFGYYELSKKEHIWARFLVIRWRVLRVYAYSDMDGSCGRSGFSFLRILHTDFYNGCTILSSHCYSLSPHPHHNPL